MTTTKNQTTKKQKRFFSKTFDAIITALKWKPNDIYDNLVCTYNRYSDDEAPDNYISSWRTRSAPNNDTYKMLVKALKDNMLTDADELNEAMDMHDFLNEMEEIFKDYGFFKNFAHIKAKKAKYNQLVLDVLGFAYSNKNVLPVTQNTNEPSRSTSKNKNLETKVVVFDFDGTLTETKSQTLWEEIWEILGYGVKECRKLQDRFLRGEITHKEWCAITEQKFKARGLKKEHLLPLIESIKLMCGIEELFMDLDMKGIDIWILSGSVDYVIRKRLDSLMRYVPGGIRANIFKFDKDGYLTQIVGTPYDFSGKEIRLRKIVEKQELQPANILYVGNSFNDEYAALAGVRTLCINPQQTNCYDKDKWDHYILNCESLTEILPYVI